MRKKVKLENNNVFFMSISDLMTGLLFIFILLFLREYLTSNKEEYNKILNEYKILKLENEKEKKKLELERENNNKLKLENEKQKQQIGLLEIENEKYRNQSKNRKKTKRSYQR